MAQDLLLGEEAYFVFFVVDVFSHESLLYLALKFRPVVLVGSFVDEVSGVGRGESMVTACRF